jgi:hypothetical protein
VPIAVVRTVVRAGEVEFRTATTSSPQQPPPRGAAPDTVIPLLVPARFPQVEDCKDAGMVTCHLTDPDFAAADRIREESGCVRRFERTFLRPVFDGSLDA